MLKLRMLFLVSVTILLVATQNVFAAQLDSTSSYFFSKGKTAYSSHFPGIPIWTLLVNDNVKFIYHTEEGRVVVKASLLESSNCDQGLNIVCFDGTVTDVINPSFEAIKVGDTFRMTIDLDEKMKQYLFFLAF